MISQYYHFDKFRETKKFKISFVPQIGGFFSDLTAEDNLNAIGEILIRDSKSRKLKIEELISKFELDAVRKVEELRNKDASFDEDVQLLIRMLES